LRYAIYAVEVPSAGGALASGNGPSNFPWSSSFGH